MKKNGKVRKLQVNWPAIIALAIALGIISYCNEKRVEEYKKEQVHNNMVRFEQTFEQSKTKIEEHELLPIITPEEYQNGRSK